MHTIKFSPTFFVSRSSKSSIHIEKQQEPTNSKDKLSNNEKFQL